MPLNEYHAKRTLDKTPEPAGTIRPAGGRTFVIQKHWATRMHYDLRIEHEGVLLSWAVPKGPSANPADKHVAIQTEDHPLEYADFEGIIPAGNYGAGAMIVWDRGTFVPLHDIAEGLEKGKLLFEFRGYKLRGTWTLVKLKKAEKEWLLIKERDGYVSTDPQVYSEQSILSGLTVEQLKHHESPAAGVIAELQKLNAVRRRIRPHDVTVMLAESRDKPFSRSGWLFEMKYDGYRLIAGREDNDVVLLSRNKRALTSTFPEIVRALQALPFDRIIIDGEVVVTDESGRPNFQRLQKRGMLRRSLDIRRAAVELPATLYVFDLLAFDEFDLRALPLIERKRLLRQLIPEKGVLQFADHIPDRGEDFFRAAEALGVEGMVGKKADSKYRAGRSADWIKVRASKHEDFVVVGFTDPGGSRSGFGALHLANYDGDELIYAGSVGTGFTAKMIDQIHHQLVPLQIGEPPCAHAPAGKGHTWIEPRFVCEVKYLEWTEEGLLRHPVFMRMRADKEPHECLRASTVDQDAEAEPETASVSVVEEPRTVAFSNLDKVFWPEDGFTKRDLIEYYRAVSPWLLPYLADRPVVLTRFPDGIHGKSFFQKDAPDFAPDWLRRESVWSEDSQRDLNYFICDDEAALLYVANSASIPLHIWASRVTSLARPDWCIIDLDPKEAPFSDVVQVAQVTQELCAEIELPAFVKTSGSSGLHIMIPMGRQVTHDQSRMFGELLARAIVKLVPGIATVERLPGKREGKVYVDYLQNGNGKLLVAPYSVRPLPGAPVSAPLEWKEVNGKLDIRSFTIRTMLKRLERKRKDPLRDVLSLSPDLVTALGKLQQRY
ncbi:MAG TPA: DNA ligase D [Longimicrobiales bacterium]|nr:DNA ligase D [Longimicrobiales bacterium]